MIHVDMKMTKEISVRCGCFEGVDGPLNRGELFTRGSPPDALRHGVHPVDGVEQELGFALHPPEGAGISWFLVASRSPTKETALMLGAKSSSCISLWTRSRSARANAIAFWILGP
jgi:hypothetical protein